MEQLMRQEHWQRLLHPLVQPLLLQTERFQQTRARLALYLLAVPSHLSPSTESQQQAA